MLTPCDDDDPLAAIATAPLLGEINKSMMNLVLIKNIDSAVRFMNSASMSIYHSASLKLPPHGTHLYMMHHLSIDQLIATTEYMLY